MTGAAKTLTLFDTAPRFDGGVYDPALEDCRLRRQLGRVCNLIRDGAWRTLQEIAATGDPHASTRVQLRHPLKPRFGAYTVEKHHRGFETTWEYRLRQDGEGGA